MIPKELHFLNQLKNTTLPFVLVMDSTGLIKTSGLSLDKLVSENLEGKSFLDMTSLVQPDEFQSILSLKPNSLVKFNFNGVGVSIKASVDFNHDKDHIILFCTPSFNSKYPLNSTHLTINDFSDSSIMAEYIFLMETTNRSMMEAYQSIGSINKKNKALEESKKSLEDLNKNLEKIVDERTSEARAINSNLKSRNKELYKMSLFPAHNPNPVIELDMDMNVVFKNEACEKFKGIKQLSLGNHPEQDKYNYILKETIKNKKDGKHSIPEGFRIDGKHFAFNVYIDNKHQFIRIYLTDVTESIQLQEELKKQRDEIFESLNYAKIIQQSILPSEDVFYDFFDSQFFLYKPRDVVSGDFYWASPNNGTLFFALCDCTGHGVPGSLLSMIGYDALNYINSLEGINGSAEFMNKLNEFFIQSRVKGRMRFNDTMDMIMFMYEPETKKFCFSGSKQKVMILRNGEILEYDTDHLNLGDDFGVVNASFNKEVLTLQKNDIIYLFTDGYVDQFGGPLGKKLKYPKFRKLLLEIHQKPLNQQKRLLENFLENWRNEYKEDPFHQLDDVSVIGFKV
ncbi:MAG: SpoIIE family protein phosphatase [Bacteroidota bacterium]|nr:SpoIIE family protein phosphatase [Bacteroidota bacterium]